MMATTNYMTYDPFNWKVLLDDKRVEGPFVNDAVIDIDDKGVTLHLAIIADVLKIIDKQSPKELKAIYFDRDHTITVTMHIDKQEVLPTAIGKDIPEVRIRFAGKPSVSYTD